MRWGVAASLAIIAVSFAIAVSLYPQMPELMASHWNARGDVDGFMPKFWALFMMPLISLGLLGLFLVLPRLDPLKKNFSKFMNYYEGFITMFTGFMFYIYVLTILWSLGYAFSMVTALIPAFGVLFIFMGFMTENVKRNWFVGIRTPWTLSSEKVWDKTHKLGGKLFKLAGLVSLLSIVLQDYAFLIMIGSVLIAAAYAYAYSYFEYKKTQKK